MSTAGDCLECDGLALERGRRQLFTPLNFELKSGGFVHLQGSNGSGKTTALRALAGLIRPAAGAVNWRGHNILGDADFHLHLNYIGHSPGLTGSLSGRENLEFYRELRIKQAYASVDAAVASVGAEAFADLPCKLLSAGQRQRLALARLRLFDCRLWMLDEPFTALDNKARQLLEQLLDQHLDAGGMVILATHQAFSTNKHPTVVALQAVT